MDLAAHFLATSLDRFSGLKSVADTAIAQLDDNQLHWRPFPGGNNIAILMKHMAGNMRSRWTDFLGSDGEKPERDRDGEFEDDLADRAQLEAAWEAGWVTLFGTLRSLDVHDLARKVYIRGEPHSVVEAIQRQISHYAYHVGQIGLLRRIVGRPGAIK